MSEIFLDTETTGLSVKDGDKIIEIACIETSDLIPTKRVFHKLLNPQKSVSQEAFKVHGFSDEFLKKQKKFEEVADEFLEFIKGKKLIIHNAPFDIGFLNNELRRMKRTIIDMKSVEDTLSLARSKFYHPPIPDNLCKRSSIDLSKRTKHNALLDCELLREVYINLVEQREPSLKFAEPGNKINENPKTKINVGGEKNIISISKEELRLHNDFLKSDLKKNFY